MHPPPLELDFNEIQCVPYHPLVTKSTEAFPRFEDFHRTNSCNSVTGNTGLDFFIYGLLSLKLHHVNVMITKFSHMNLLISPL